MGQKIIGRFEPIGKEVGPPRRAFNVRDKIAVGSMGLFGKPGFYGLTASGRQYSVLSEYWRFVPVEQENV